MLLNHALIILFRYSHTFTWSFVFVLADTNTGNFHFRGFSGTSSLQTYVVSADTKSMFILNTDPEIQPDQWEMSSIASMDCIL